MLSIPCDKLPWLLLKKPPIYISIDEWIEVWGNIVGKAKIMEDLPMWLQYYPKVLFNIINRSGSGIIIKTELKLFYTAFMIVGKLGETRVGFKSFQSFIL